MSEKMEIVICLGSSCFSRGNREQLKEITEYIRLHHLGDFIEFKGTRCFGACQDGPSYKINGELLSYATTEMVIEKISQFISGKK